MKLEGKLRDLKAAVYTSELEKKKYMHRPREDISPEKG